MNRFLSLAALCPGVFEPPCAGSRVAGADVLSSAGFSGPRRVACLGEPQSRSRQALRVGLP